MKTLLFLLVLTGSAGAQVTTTALLLPSFGGGARQPWSPYTANQLACWRLPARLGITGATNLAGAIPAPVPFFAACTAGFAIYNDNDNATGSVLASVSGDCSHSNIVKNSAPLASFSLVQATIYRLCVCLTNTGGYYLGVLESNPNLAATKSDVLNGSVTRAAIATNSCVAGVPPTGTGVLTTKITSGTGLTTNASGYSGEPPMMEVE